MEAQNVGRLLVGAVISFIAVRMRDLLFGVERMGKAVLLPSGSLGVQSCPWGKATVAKVNKGPTV